MENYKLNFHQDEVGDLHDDELIDQVQQDLHHQSQPIGLSNENGTIHVRYLRLSQ